MCFCVFFSFFLWWENTKTHTICCVFVFFCLKSSWHFLPCVFCVFVFFFFKFLSWYFCTFLFCHVPVLPDQKFCRFFLAFFRFISCLLSANIFFWLILICFLVYSWIISFFWILSSLPVLFSTFGHSLLSTFIWGPSFYKRKKTIKDGGVAPQCSYI